MNLVEFFKDLWRDQKLLMLAGLGHFILFVVLTVASLFDSQEVLGINRWIKPMKFAVSIAVFLWTLAIYLHFLSDKYKTSKRNITWLTIAMMIGEMVLIVVQAIRGTTSHFNVTTPLNGIIFGSMGLMIVLNTLGMIYLAYIYFRAEFDLPKAIVWGMRLGLVIFIFGSIQGGYMSSQMAHTVGMADGGAGLPLINWSTEGGDLRAAHFIGLHAFQSIPLFALLLVFLQKRISFVRPLALTIIFAVLYTASFTFVFTQALLGKPLLNKELAITKKLVNLETGDKNAK